GRLRRPRPAAGGGEPGPRRLRPSGARRRRDRAVPAGHRRLTAMIRVQREDFDIGRELAALTEGDHAVGGLGVFVGLVRDLAGGGTVRAMTLEHYPGMTEKQLAAIEAEARARWPLQASLIVHRYGRLEPGDRIVLVACASAH